MTQHQRPHRLPIVFSESPLYFVTCCTANRQPILATPGVHEAFRAGAEVTGKAGAAVGRYVIMPDHMHEWRLVKRVWDRQNGMNTRHK